MHKFRTFKLQREWCKNELIAPLIIHDAFLTFFLMIRLYSFKSTSNYRNFNKVQLIFLCLIHGSCRSRIWFTYQIKKIDEQLKYFKHILHVYIHVYVNIYECLSLNFVTIDNTLLNLIRHLVNDKIFPVIDLSFLQHFKNTYVH